MILSTFHALNKSSLKENSISLGPHKTTTINTFNDHYISFETQSLICDLLETIICNEERIRHLRETLIKDKDFDPINLFQIVTRSYSTSNNTLTRENLAHYISRPPQDL